MVETLLHMDGTVILAFILAGFLLNLTPGVDFLYITASGINGGPDIGRAAAIGILFGVVAHVSAAVLGVSALLLAYPAAYEIIRYLGVAYLLFMAWQAWHENGQLGEGKAALSKRDAIKRGFFTNILNPKTALFIFAFIPQFTDPTIGPLWHQIMILGVIFTFNGFVFAMLLGTAAGHLAPVLRNHVLTLNKITAVLFGGIAAKLVWD